MGQCGVCGVNLPNSCSTIGWSFTKHHVVVINTLLCINDNCCIYSKFMADIYIVLLVGRTAYPCSSCHKFNSRLSALFIPSNRSLCGLTNESLQLPFHSHSMQSHTQTKYYKLQLHPPSFLIPFSHLYLEFVYNSIFFLSLARTLPLSVIGFFLQYQKIPTALKVFAENVGHGLHLTWRDTHEMSYACSATKRSFLCPK